jgi:ATP-dependent DNA helicase RecQ
VQEAGRAGRDGLPARCLLVARRHDAVLHVKRLNALAPSGRKPARKRLIAMRGYVNERICRRAAIARWFGERAPDCQGCDLCRP